MHPSHRRQVVAEWRGYQELEDPGRNLRTAAEAMRPWLESLVDSDFIGEEKIKQAWASVVGPFLAAQTEPVSLRRGVLMIRVVQPAIRYSLEQGMKNALLKRVQAELGSQLVQSLAFTTI